MLTLVGVFLLSVACSAGDSETPVDLTSLSATPALDEDTAEAAAFNYIMYSDEFDSQNDFGAAFLADIKGALCDGLDWTVDEGQIRWTVLCWLRLEGPLKGDNYPDDDTVHWMRFYFYEKDWDVDVAPY